MDLPRRKSPLVRKLRGLLPWAIGAALLGFVFWRVPIHAAWIAAREARLELFLPLVLVAVLAWFVLESAVYTYAFSRFNAPISWREARSLRGLTYLVTPIHWNLGKLAVVLRLWTSKRVPILEGTSTVVLIQMIDGAVLATLASLGLAMFIESPELARTRWIAFGCVAMIVAGLALISSGWPRSAMLDRVRQHALLRSLRAARPRDLAIIFALKSAYHGVFVLGFYLGTRAFGVDLPFALVLATTPIIQAIGALPLTPAGLGTQQTAMLYFWGASFGAMGSEPAIVAFGFSFPIAVIAVRCALGLVYLAGMDDPASTLHQTG